MASSCNEIFTTAIAAIKNEFKITEWQIKMIWKASYDELQNFNKAGLLDLPENENVIIASFHDGASPAKTAALVFSSGWEHVIQIISLHRSG